jgi:hypothetical protein
MKLRLFNILFIVLAIGLNSCSKDIDNILKEHYQARGGDEITKVTSVYAEGQSMSMMMHMPFRMNFVIPTKLRYDFVVMGKVGSSIFNGDRIWMLEDSVYTEVPSQFVADNKRDMVHQAKIFKSDLVDYYLTRQGKIEYLGKDTANSLEYHRIKIVKDSIETEFWIDTKTFLEYKIIYIRSVGKNKVIETVKFTDFKKEGSLMLPHSVSVSVSNADEMPKPGSKLTFNKFVVNKKIDESIFMPSNIMKEQPVNQNPH